MPRDYMPRFALGSGAQHASSGDCRQMRTRQLCDSGKSANSCPEQNSKGRFGWVANPESFLTPSALNDGAPATSDNRFPDHSHGLDYPGRSEPLRYARSHKEGRNSVCFLRTPILEMPAQQYLRLLLVRCQSITLRSQALPAPCSTTDFQ